MGHFVVLDAEDEDLKRMALELDATEVLRLTEGTTRDKETVLGMQANIKLNIISLLNEVYLY